MTDIRTDIQKALRDFARLPLAGAGLALLETLGYQSEKRFDLHPNSAAQFAAEFDPQKRMNGERAMLEAWVSVDVLAQVTDDEVRAALGGQKSLFAGGRVDGTVIHSFLFFAIALDGEAYSRAQLAGITREVNKRFPMPVMILFRHGESLSLAMITRRLNKVDDSRDVLEKVTIIKDVSIAQPHRAHLEILEDLSLPALAGAYAVSNFVELQRAWEKTLDTSELNKRFYREVANWYFWAVRVARFPTQALTPGPSTLTGTSPDGRGEETANATAVIRLITRLIFVWFIKEKGLVPGALFEREKVDALLDFGKDEQRSGYYKAILQNLFFATLNTEMGPGRKFRNRNTGGGLDGHHGISTVYRFQEYFKSPDAALGLFKDIPFLNGGLFECLDKPEQKLYVDGFSDTPRNQPVVPDALFFGEKHAEDLSEAYGDARRNHEPVRGLLHIFESYKFTVEENTPIEEEVALDPELLGKVFENLLAAYNPETGTTARKQTGSFYTPREIVNYMVDEALVAYLDMSLRDGDLPSKQSALGDEEIASQKALAMTSRLRSLLAYDNAPHDFDTDEVTRLIAAIDNIKVLDPAAGSGAFPMGVLHKLVFILNKLDPGNQRWKEKQVEKASDIPDATVREKVLEDIEQAFGGNELDYGRKLYLIENCIYGVDIQPIAVQIAKLRFFISLVVEQKIDRAKPNLGIRPLPNLETKFVAANTLIGIEKPAQMMFRNPEIDRKEKKLAEVRAALFTAKTPDTKKKRRAEDAQLRAEIADLLKKDGWGSETAAKLAGWNPYDQNASADFFDPEWMFGISGGFDVVIGNPPYGMLQPHNTDKGTLDFFNSRYHVASFKIDLFHLFMEKSIFLLKNGGNVLLIVPNTFITNVYSRKLRDFIASKCKITQIIVSSDRLFSSAEVNNAIINLNKEEMVDKRKNNSICIVLDADLNFLIGYQSNAVFHNIKQEDLMFLSSGSWNIKLSNDTVKLINGFLQISEKLGTIAKINRGLISGDRDKYFSATKNNEKWLPIITGTDIERYAIREPKEYILFEKPKGSGGTWDRDVHLSKKVVVRQIGYFPIASYDIHPYCVTGNIFTIRPEKFYKAEYILGILNSKFTQWLWKLLYGDFKAIFPELKGIYLEQFPIRRINPENLAELSIYNSLIANVEQILAAKRADPAADTSALEAEIDRLVYQVYGLGEDEIAIVEGR